MRDSGLRRRGQESVTGVGTITGKHRPTQAKHFHVSPKPRSFLCAAGRQKNLAGMLHWNNRTEFLRINGMGRIYQI